MLAASSIYEPQLPRLGRRTCGAAALCMVYRSLGRDCSQADIWARLCQAGRTRGGVRTRRLAADAIEAGLAAVVVQAELPWEFLQACSGAGLEVILNHRLAIDSPWGHYSVLSQIDSHTAWIHDPQIGPSRPLSRDELLQLWQGASPRTEIRGHVAVLIARQDTPVTLGANCLNCQFPVSLDPIGRLEPSAAMGKLWRCIYCPGCDWSTENTLKHPDCLVAGDVQSVLCNATN